MSTPTPYPNIEGQITVPYVSVQEFRAAPTWLDTQDLIPGGQNVNQDAELQNVLIRASQWANNYCNQRLSAHTNTENTRTRVRWDGTVWLHPSFTPVRQVTGLAYGGEFQQMVLLTDFTQVWVEDSRGILVSMIPFRGTWSGSLEFGNLPPNGGEVFVQYSYVSGFASTYLSATAAANQNQIVLNDVTGLSGPVTTLGLGNTLPGSLLRIWDPGNEEAVTVQSINGNTVTLASNLIYPHTVASSSPGDQVLVSEMPADIHQAVISLAVGLLMRDDVSGEEPFSGAPFGPAMRRAGVGGQSGGLINDAYELLGPYRRVGPV